MQEEVLAEDVYVFSFSVSWGVNGDVFSLIGSNNN
jgi:hypothetical protein